MIIAIPIALAVSLWLTRRFCNPASGLHILDHPNERSLHAHPVPRSGGVAVAGGLLAGWMTLWLAGDGGWAFDRLLFIALPVAIVSFLDDRSGVNPGLRILVHFAAAALLIGAGYTLDAIRLPGLTWALSPWLAPLLPALFVVWMINLYNFMDGMDGFAGGMTVIGFGTLSLLGTAGGDALFAGASATVAAAALGFLVFNFPPAKIFLGDCGSSTLGFLAAGFSLWGNREGLFPLWSALFIFSPFIVDATVTLGRRLARGEKIWRPHKTHYYQRLVQLGWGHRKTLLAEYLLMFTCSLSALAILPWPAGAQLAFLLIWLLIYILLALGVGGLERRHGKVKAP